MKMCKQATESSCGKQHCCIECDIRESCPDVCATAVSGAVDGCPDAYDEENSLQEFQSAVPKAIEMMGAILQKKKEIEKAEADMKAQLVDAMKKYGVKSFKNDVISITYKAPSTRTSIDSARLKKEHPEIAEAYSKTSPVKESVMIKLKDD